jgi:uncharacterized protein
MPLPRTLTPIEIRILGSLLEKQVTTPDTYPLTLNSLMLAANQRTSREPVTDHAEEELARALDQLQESKLVWKVFSGRAVKYDQNFADTLTLEPEERAVMTLLMLRGAQTAGEIRSRSDRLHTFESVAQVESVLRGLAGGEEPLVVELPRQAGRKENRWMHLLAGEVEVDALPVVEPPRPQAARSSLEERVARLEESVARLTEELERLRGELGA